MTTAKDTNATSKDIQADLQALQEDVAKLTKQFADMFSERGSTAWQRAKANVDDVLSEAQAKGATAIDSVRDASDGVLDALEDSLRQRPYTTLALAVGLGFVVGTLWRR